MKRRPLVRMVLGGPKGGLGGAQRIVDHLEERLVRDGCDVEWFGPANLSRLPRSQRWPGLNEALRTLAVARALRSLPRADLTLSHGMYGVATPGRRIHVYHGTYAGLANACRAGLPRLDYLVGRWINGTLEQASGIGATRVVVSEAVRGEISREYGLKSDALIHNGVDVEHFQAPAPQADLRVRLGLPADAYLLLVVGRMDYGKGREVVAGMLPHLPERVHLVLAAPEAAGVDRLPQDRLHLLPGVPFEELPAFYGACDALLCPSLYEGFGLTLLEAWATGLPVVTGRLGVVPEIEALAPELSAGVASVADAEGLARAVKRLMADPAEAQRLALQGQALVRERFSLDRFTNAYSDLARTLLSRGTRDGLSSPAVSVPPSTGLNP